jgi:hypothetical protein
MIPERSLSVQQQDRKDRTPEGRASASNVVPSEEPNHKDRKFVAPKETSKTLSVQQSNQRRRRPPGIDPITRLSKKQSYLKQKLKTRKLIEEECYVNKLSM